MTDENQPLPLTDKTLKASNFHTVIRKMAAVDSGNRSIAFRAAVQQYAIFGHCDSFLISYALTHFPESGRYRSPVRVSSTTGVPPGR